MADPSDTLAETNATTASLRRALDMKKKGASGAGVLGADERPSEKMVAAKSAAMNKPAFRKASKRG